MGKVVDFINDKERVKAVEELVGEAEINCMVNLQESRCQFKATDVPTLLTLLMETTMKIIERVEEVSIDDYCKILKEGYKEFKEFEEENK